MKLIDFGVSKFSRPFKEGEHRMTRADAVLGTPCYMSPEQARGASETDVRSDIYSCGVILFESVTGRLPFEGETFNDLMFKIALSDAPSPLELRADARSRRSRRIIGTRHARAIRTPASRRRRSSPTRSTRGCARTTSPTPCPSRAAATRRDGFSAPTLRATRPRDTPPWRSTRRSTRPRHGQDAAPTSRGRARRRRPPSNSGAASRGAIVAIGAAAIVALGIGIATMVDRTRRRPGRAAGSLAPVQTAPGTGRRGGALGRGRSPSPGRGPRPVDPDPRLPDSPPSAAASHRKPEPRESAAAPAGNAPRTRRRPPELDLETEGRSSIHWFRSWLLRAQLERQALAQRYALWFPVTVDGTTQQMWAVCKDVSAGGILISGTASTAGLGVTSSRSASA